MTVLPAVIAALRKRDAVTNGCLARIIAAIRRMRGASAHCAFRAVSLDQRAPRYPHFDHGRSVPLELGNEAGLVLFSELSVTAFACPDACRRTRSAELCPPVLARWLPAIGARVDNGRRWRVLNCPRPRSEPLATRSTANQVTEVSGPEQLQAMDATGERAAQPFGNEVAHGRRFAGIQCSASG
ncbi:MAG: hypothetical protein ABJL13_02050 [Tateyamaria sp.]